jgi:DMSO/TMAO reductase YedYZ molybdopterin-dependent catalytic subunit
VDPLSSAKYIAFQSLYDPKQMPQGRYAGVQLPYEEGLRIDEAMYPLALLCLGLCGEILPNQNGAPICRVVPWKCGFKSIKPIVRFALWRRNPDYLEHFKFQRVRFLLECEPRGTSSCSTAVRTEHHVVFEEYLEKLKTRLRRFRCMVVASRPGMQWRGTRG